LILQVNPVLISDDKTDTQHKLTPNAKLNLSVIA
jgi:hypothetical protein